jgi:hypothetical protein
MDSPTRRLMLAGLVAAALNLQARRAHAAGIATEQRSVSGFDRIDWQALGELHIEQTGRERLVIEAEPAVLAKTRTEVRQGRLHISFASGRIDTRLPIRFRLEVKSLRALAADGAGEIHIGALSTPELALKLAGSDTLRVARLDARSLDVQLDGSGDLDIEGGSVASQRVALSGSGRYIAPALASRQAEASLEGSGDVELAVSERLVARVSGSGDVLYHGRPQVHETADGAGSVRAAGAQKD